MVIPKENQKENTIKNSGIRNWRDIIKNISLVVYEKERQEL